MIYEVLNNNAVINTIVADIDFMTANFPQGNYRVLQAPTPELPYVPRHISVGAFFDRFGAQKYPILASTDPGVKALIQDVSVRKYIDLDNVQLPYGLAMLVAAGYPIIPEDITDATITEAEKP